MKKVQPNKKSTNRTKPSANKQRATSLTWSFPARRIRRSWWWWVVYFWLLLAITLLSILFQNWFALIAELCVFGILLFQNFTKAPAQILYLQRDKILVEYAGKRPRTEEILLDGHKAFTTVEVTANRLNPTQRYIVLQPKVRFGLSSYAALPEDLDHAIKIAEALEQQLPFVEEGGFVTSERFSVRFFRQLGLR